MKKIFFLTILLAITVSAQTVRNNDINLSKAQPEATPVTVFPYNGGTGTYTVTTSTTASYSITNSNVAITSESVTPSGTGQIIKVNYSVAATQSPRNASITVTVTGYTPVTLSIKIAGQGSVTSAASYSPGKIAHGALTTFWAADLGTVTTATSLPLPTTLSGTKILRQQFGTNEFTECPMLFISPSQANFYLPDSSTYGMFVIYSLDAGGNYYSAFASVNNLAPDVFTVNSTGNEYDHASITIQRNDGGVTKYESPTLHLDQANHWVADPITLTPETYFLFYASGARKDVSLAACYAIIDDTIQLPLVYAGAQGQYVGLDQLAFKASSLSSGTHKVQFVVNGWRSNPVRIPVK